MPAACPLLQLTEAVLRYDVLDVQRMREGSLGCPPVPELKQRNLTLFGENRGSGAGQASLERCFRSVGREVPPPAAPFVWVQSCAQQHHLHAAFVHRPTHRVAVRAISPKTTRKDAGTPALPRCSLQRAAPFQRPSTRTPSVPPSCTAPSCGPSSSVRRGVGEQKGGGSRERPLFSGSVLRTPTGQDPLRFRPCRALVCQHWRPRCPGAAGIRCQGRFRWERSAPLLPLIAAH